MTTSKLADKYIVKRNKIRNQYILLQGDRKVKETMYRMASRILTEIEQWRENSSTDDTLNSLTSIQTFILREEEEAATEIPSILRLMIKKIKIAGSKPQI